MTHIGGSLSGLVSHNNAVWVHKSERIDNDFAFDRLHRVNYDCNRTSVDRFMTTWSDEASPTPGKDSFAYLLRVNVAVVPL